MLGFERIADTIDVLEHWRDSRVDTVEIVLIRRELDVADLMRVDVDDVLNEACWHVDIAIAIVDAKRPPVHNSRKPIHQSVLTWPLAEVTHLSHV